MASNEESEQARQLREVKKEKRARSNSQAIRNARRKRCEISYTHTRTELVLTICLDWLGAESMIEIEGLP